MIDSNETVVYESPDGGHTLYSRRLGHAERTLVYQSHTVNLRNRWQTWGEILKAAQDNPTLEDAIQKAEMLYVIIKEED